MKSFFVLATVFVLVANSATAQPTPDAAFVYPIIPKFGGVVPLPKAAEQPRKGGKIVMEITATAKPTEVNKGLERAARLLNLYGAAGLKATDVKLVLVFHGEATKSILTDEAYKAKFGSATNPNLEVIGELRKAGVEIFVCGQALHNKGYKQAEVGKDVTVAASALTVVVNRQNDGYALVLVP